LDLSKLDWSYDKDAPIRLCFDNRPLHESYNGAVSIGSRWVNQCRHYSFHSHGDYEKYLDDDRINRGVLTYRNEDNVITCEAVFTGRSLFSFVANYQLEDESSERNKPKITPYRWATNPAPVYETIEDMAAAPDFIEASFDSGGILRIKKINIKNTWDCLLPSYRFYWQKIYDSCLINVEEIVSNSTVNSIYSPILEENHSSIQNLISPCLIEKK